MKLILLLSNSTSTVPLAAVVPELVPTTSNAVDDNIVIVNDSPTVRRSSATKFVIVPVPTFALFGVAT